MGMSTKTKPSPSWRDALPVHPAAELFPRMSEVELAALGKDIKMNGLTSPIVLWSDGRSPERLLDGRSRLDAIEIAIGPVEIAASSLTAGKDFLAVNKVIVLDRSVDPYAYVISANIHRRHLSIEDKDGLIVKVLQADATKSNRQVAKMVKASHPHVAKVREQAEKTGDVETVTTSIDTKGRQQSTKRKPVTEQQVRDKALRNKSEAIKAAQARADIGPASNGEIARIRTRNEELETENVRLRRENTALRGEIEKLKARLLDIPDFLDRTKRTTHPTC
jgi:DNA-binding Lrp family transcriptional regulator